MKHIVTIRNLHASSSNGFNLSVIEIPYTDDMQILEHDFYSVILYIKERAHARTHGVRFLYTHKLTAYSESGFDISMHTSQDAQHPNNAWLNQVIYIRAARIAHVFEAKTAM